MKLEKSCRKNSGKIQFIFGVIASILCLCLFTLGDLQAKEAGESARLQGV